VANTLTGLIPSVYQALDIVSRERTGMITACTIDAGTAGAALGQSILVPLAPAAAAEDITPASIPPDTGDQVIGNVPVTITKSRDVPFRITGEEYMGLTTGPTYNVIRESQIAQAFRTLCNEIEGDLTGLFNRTSRSFGTAGTPALATNLDQVAELYRILADNGAPPNDLQLIINTASGVNLRKQTQLQRVNEAGTDTFIRQGLLIPLFGMEIRESAQIKSPAKGTGTGYTTTAAGFPVGTTSIPLITGSGTILAGDRITIAGDTANIYNVITGIAAPGTIVIGAPGLRQAVPASAQAVTVGNLAALNLAFHRSAMVLVARPPAKPPDGDMASDTALITDPRSGMTFEFAQYKGYNRTRYEIRLAWGVQGVKPEHSAILLG
jgi:P22 coat protein - gene protein 5